MSRMLSGFAAACLCLTGSAAAQPITTLPVTQDPVEAAQLVGRLRVPYETFTLDNGLRVIVHEDRKAPIVAVTVWYNVGSKHEPAGQSGYAHLFEHLMYNGSENAPGDFFAPLREMGATDLNGSTWPDHTNYYQTVPTSALERTLFLESDRMGHLLGAVTQETLANQIAVVQNEIRQGENEPFGLVGYAQGRALFPPGHPYRNPTVGSMRDLSGATLENVRAWFRDHYSPNNAILVLAGDISSSRAKALVERYFGSIPRGRSTPPVAVSVPSLPVRLDQTLQDRVASTRIYRNWAVPGITHDDHTALEVAASVLGGIASSRLGNALVRQEQSAVRVNAYVQPFQHVGVFEIQVDVKNGQDPDAVGRRLDEIIAEFIRSGPTASEVQRSAMRMVSGRIQGLERVGTYFGKAVALAESTLYAGDPGFYKARLERIAGLTPARVQSAMQRWLTRPVYALRVDPGERTTPPEGPPAPVATAAAQANASPQPVAAQAPARSEAQPRVARREAPPVGDAPELDFPEVERARLSNGIQVTYARRSAVPVTRVTLEFDAGSAADPADRTGTQSLMLNLLKEGTASFTSAQIAEAQERLGATISTSSTLDRTAVSLTAATPNLRPSLGLLADLVRNPAFAPSEVERLRQQQLASIGSELTEPHIIARRVLPPILFGAEHPYGRPFIGSGDPAVIGSLTRDELIRFRHRWIRPDNVTIFAVGDLRLDELLPLLEANFGTWQAPPVARGVKQFDRAIPVPQPRILLVNRPQSPQSYILAGQVLPVRGTQDLLLLSAANEALGSNFLSRINMELRERKGWSYGARGALSQFEHQVPYLIFGSVQTDRTADSIRAVIEQVRGFLSSDGVQPSELSRIVLGNTRQLPGQFEASEAVLGALRSNALHRRPDNYWETVSGRYRQMTRQSLDDAARGALNPNNFVWVVVGDASLVRPQLEGLGLPIEVIQPR